MLRLHGADLHSDLHQVGSLQYSELMGGGDIGRAKERFELLLNFNERVHPLEGLSSKGETKFAGQWLRFLLCQELFMNLLLNKGRRNVQASSFTKAYSIRVCKGLGVERDCQLFGSDGNIEDSLNRLGTTCINILRA